jgi:hypothetical protein
LDFQHADILDEVVCQLSDDQKQLHLLLGAFIA